MPDIFFKCESCGKQLVVDYTGAETAIDCPDCNSQQAIPHPATLQYCPHCNKAIKIDHTLGGAVLHCQGCAKSILLPVRRGEQIVCLCKRCEKTIEIPAAEAGKLLACPKCEGWIRGPEPSEIAGESPASADINRPAGTVRSAPATALGAKLAPPAGHHPAPPDTDQISKPTFASPVRHPVAATDPFTEVRQTKSYPQGSAQAVLQNLENEAQRLASYHCFFLAAFLLQYYDGEYAEETKAARSQIARHYFELANQQPTALWPEESQSGQQIHTDC